MDKNISSQLALSVEQMLQLKCMGVDISDTRLAWYPLYWPNDPTTLIGYYLMDKVVAESEICDTIWPTYTLEDIMLKLPLAEVRYNELMPKDRNWVTSICLVNHHFLKKSFSDKTPLDAAFNMLKRMAIEYPNEIIRISGNIKETD